MECLNDLVGIKNTCETPVSKSGLWLQDLKGFSLKLADAAIDEETSSGLELIREKYIFAQNAILAQFRAQFQDKIRSGSVISNDTIGYYPEKLKVIIKDNTVLKGIKIEIKNQAYLEIFISSIGLLFKDAVVAPIEIYNLITGKLLDTFEIETIAGEPTYISVNKSYPTQNQRLVLFIAFDAGLSDYYDSSLSKSGPSCCGQNTTSNPYSNVGGIKISKASQKITGNGLSTPGTSGLTVDYSLNCNVDNLLCSVAGKFAWPLLHKWGAEIMDELIFSRRLNSIITIDRSLNQQLKDEYEEEYLSSMSALFNNMKMPNDICFSCNARSRKVVSIP